jgi:hypothetical protein
MASTDVDALWLLATCDTDGEVVFATDSIMKHQVEQLLYKCPDRVCMQGCPLALEA